MAGINKVILIGNLGRDPELRYTQGGTAVCNLSIATSRKYKGRNDQTVEETEWHRVVVWSKQAEFCNQYLTKGRQVYVEGRLQTRNYEDKDGIKRYSTEVVADTVQFLGGRQGDGGGYDQRGGGGYGGPPQDRRGGYGGGYGGPPQGQQDGYGGGPPQGPPQPHEPQQQPYDPNAGTDDDIPF